MPERRHLSDLRVSGSLYANNISEGGQSLIQKYALSGLGGGGASNIFDLTNVQNTGWVSGNLMAYDGTKWVPYSDTPGISGNYEASGTADARISSHEAAGDPHPQYWTTMEGQAEIANHADPLITPNAHTQYIKKDGSEDFTGTVGGISGVVATDFVTKGQAEITFQASGNYQPSGNYQVFGDYVTTDTVQIISASKTFNAIQNFNAGLALVGSVGITGGTAFDFGPSVQTPIDGVGTIGNASFEYASMYATNFYEGGQALTAKYIQAGDAVAISGDTMGGPLYAPGLISTDYISGTNNLYVGGDIYENGSKLDTIYALSGTGGGSGGTPVSTTKKSVETHTVIEEKAFTSDASSYTFSSIPSGYDRFRIVGEIRSDVGGTDTGSCQVYFNGDTTNANYRQTNHRGDGTTHTANENDNAQLIVTPGGLSPSNYWGGFELDIQNPNSSNYKVAKCWSFGRVDTNKGLNYHRALQWENTAAITSITIQDSSSNIISGTQLKLIGIKEEEVVTDVTGGSVNSPTLTVYSSGLKQSRMVIDRVELTASASSITIDNIPDGYDHFEIRTRLRTDRASNEDACILSINDDTTDSNYKVSQHIFRNSSVHSAADYDGRTAFPSSAASANSNYFGDSLATITYESKSGYPIIALRGTTRGPDADQTTYERNMMWENTSRITKLHMAPNTGPNWVSGCVVELIGFKEEYVITSGVYGDLKISNGNIVP